MAENNASTPQAKVISKPFIGNATSVQAISHSKLNDKFKQKFQVLSFQPKIGDTSSLTYNTSTEFERVIGITIDSDNRTALNKSTISMNIDSNEIFPKDFDTALISRKDNVGFYDNMYMVNERANNSTVKIDYTDNMPSSTQPYNVKVYLWCTMIKN